jgi:DNA-binding transcriptional LysR family regulator
MTLEQLRIFVAVADRLSMTRAADTLHLTQSAVSAAIAALEARHATRLFDRIGRGLALSEAGTVFLPEARAVLARAEAAVLVLDDLAGLRRGALRIAASQTVATYWLPARLARFAAAHPGVKLTLLDGNTTEAAAAVLAGEADLGIVEGSVTEPALLRETIGGDRLGLYTAPGHPLAGMPIDAVALRGAAWVLREPGSGTRDHFEAAIAAKGVAVDTLDVRLELPSNGAALAAVEAGGLVTAVSDLAAAPRVAAGLVVRLDFDLPPRAFVLLLHGERHRSRAVATFLAEIAPPDGTATATKAF